jgi:hypothetical protein
MRAYWKERFLEVVIERLVIKSLHKLLERTATISVAARRTQWVPASRRGSWRRQNIVALPLVA